MKLYWQIWHYFLPFLVGGFCPTGVSLQKLMNVVLWELDKDLVPALSTWEPYCLPVSYAGEGLL